MALGGWRRAGLVFPGAGGSGEACRVGDCCPWPPALHVEGMKGVTPGCSPDVSTHRPPSPQDGAGRAGGGCVYTSGGRGRCELRLSQVDAGVTPGPVDAPVDTCFRRSSSSTLSLALPCRPGGPGERSQNRRGRVPHPQICGYNGLWEPGGEPSSVPAPHGAGMALWKAWVGSGSLVGQDPFPFKSGVVPLSVRAGQRGDHLPGPASWRLPQADPPASRGMVFAGGGPRPTCSATSVPRAAGAWGLLPGAPLCVLPGDLSRLPNIRTSITCE